MLVEYTPEERRAIEDMEDYYRKRLVSLEERIAALRPDFMPNTSDLYEGLDPFQNSKEWNQAVEKENEIISAWEAAGSQEWKDERAKWWMIRDERVEERERLWSEAEKRQFDELGNDPQTIFENGKEQTRKILQFIRETHSASQPLSATPYLGIVPGANNIKRLDPEETRDHILRELHLHLKALEGQQNLCDELHKFILTTIAESPFIDRRIKPEAEQTRPSPMPVLPSTAKVRSTYPKSYITPIDKLSNLAFTGELHGSMVHPLAMERRGSKRQITTLVSIDFEQFDPTVSIPGRKQLTAYDREVHDAIITLYVNGGNEYITPQMIYQTMTGNPKAIIPPKQAEAISESITKCMYSRVIIRADEEAKAYGFDSYQYDGNLVLGERVTATINGTVLECLHVLRKPVLYEYADKKNQIGRFDIRLLNSPINKTEEIITLQGYLYRRILAMKGSPLSKTILYETVYEQIGVSAASDGALRKKKSKVRSQIKSILEYWKQENFIRGFTENMRKKESYSIIIEL